VPYNHRFVCLPRFPPSSPWISICALPSSRAICSFCSGFRSSGILLPQSSRAPASLAWIQDQLKNTTVTVVLIGTETASREWVRYEIRESWKRGNAIVGVRIHGIKDPDSKTDNFGVNPLDVVKFEGGTTLSTVCKTYDWVADQGRENLGEWLEEAVQAREDVNGENIIEQEPKKSIARASVLTGPSVIQNPPKPWAR
jgi:hypothetical protein